MGEKERKNELRSKMLEQRESIPSQQFYSVSNVMINRLIRQPEFADAETVHCYVSMNDRREVNTHELLKQMLRQKKKVVVPITNFDDGTLTHIRLSEFEDLSPNKWDVLEPESGKEVSVGDLDLVIVPMVAGDEQGNRIGYGKGFYDRFLVEVDCPKMGLVFEKNIIPQLPTEDFDIPLDSIVTEKRVINPS